MVPGCDWLAVVVEGGALCSVHARQPPGVEWLAAAWLPVLASNCFSWLVVGGRLFCLGVNGVSLACPACMKVDKKRGSHHPVASKSPIAPTPNHKDIFFLAS